MKQIKTLANSFVLLETDGSGNVTFQLGYPKGGLTYLIKNRSIKFYLTEDYFYKNVVWSANIPLMVDGVMYNADTLPVALKKIFENKDGGGGEVTVDTELNIDSFNPIANSPVAIKVNQIDNNIAQLANSILNRYTKTEVDSLLSNFYSKAETNTLIAGYSAILNGDTLSLNDKNITI